MIWVYLDCFVKGCDGVVVLLKRIEGNAFVNPGCGMVLVYLDCSVIGCDGVVVLLKFTKDSAFVIPG
jgi:hypothetical protein